MVFANTRRSAPVLFAMLCLSVVSVALAAAEQPAAYISFAVEGALGTFPLSINSSMAVAGYYLVAPGVARGFVRAPTGVITTFSVRDQIWTQPESINANGDITGFYEESPGVPHGFIRHADGSILTFNPPVAGLSGPQAQPVSINTFGQIAGNYPYPAEAPQVFIRAKSGALTTFGFGLGAANGTVVTSLNDSGTSVGYVTPGGASSRGFIMHPDGFSLQFDVPAFAAGTNVVDEVTIAESVNDDGVIAGWYAACTGKCDAVVLGGFVRSPEGAFTLFNPPGTIATLTELGFTGQAEESLFAPHHLSINRQGTIAGSSIDASGGLHGFVRNVDGIFSAFDPPKGQQTTATSINDDGVVAGSYYYDWNNQVAVGFLRIPNP